MPRISRGAALIAMLIVWTPHRAAADGYMEFINRCGGGSFTSCISARLWVTGTTVKLHVWNLSGGALGGHPGSVFTKISLENVGTSKNAKTFLDLAVNGATGMSGPRYTGPPGISAGMPMKWLPTNTAGAIHLGKAASTENPIEYGIASDCVTTQAGGNPVPNGTALWMSKNCGSSLVTSGSALSNYAVEMSFSLTQTFNPITAGTRLGITAASIDLAQQYNTTTYYAYATPEPASMLLLGSGLLGLGGAAARRRRRTRAEAESLA